MRDRVRTTRITFGEFRDVIDIYSDSSDPNDEQQEFVGTPFMSSIPAKIEEVGGHEKEQTSFSKYEVICHYLDDVTASMQVKVTEGPFAGDVLNIGNAETARNHGRPRYLILECTKIN